MKADKALAGQGLRYLFAGGSAALLELALFELLLSIVGAGVVVSNVIATVVATTYNFLFNRNVTFKSTSNPIRSLVLYIALFLGNMAISTAAIAFMIDCGVPSVVAKMIMQVCVMLWNFILYRKVVFK